MRVIPRHPLVVIGAVDADTADEALRAAVGLTLRRSRVTVVLADPQIALGDKGERARRTLLLFEHPVVLGDALAEQLGGANLVEVWGPVAATPPPALPRFPKLHLVRPGHAPSAVASWDTVIDLPETIDDDAADRILDLMEDNVVIVW